MFSFAPSQVSTVPFRSHALTVISITRVSFTIFNKCTLSSPWPLGRRRLHLTVNYKQSDFFLLRMSRRCVRCLASFGFLLLLGSLSISLRTSQLIILSNESNERSLRMPYLPANNNTNQRAGSPSPMAACLLMKDDNHWLIEWIAFHYFALPLRDLVVIRDPGSVTSSQHIFDRWKSRIRIEEWDADAVVPAHKWEQFKAGKIDETRLHRARQQHFYAQCLRHFRKQKKQWILLSDTDEFIQPNFYALAEGDRVSLSESGSIWKTIKLQEQKRRNNNQRIPTCLHIPRIQMSSLQSIHSHGRSDETETDTDDDDDDNSVSPLLNTSHLLTTGWVHHDGKEIVQIPGANLDGKNLIHVSALQSKDIPFKAHSVHLVIPKHCPSTNGNRLEHADSWLVIYHYPGTYEQYNFRDDPRDALKHRQKRWDLWKGLQSNAATSVRDDSMGDWLAGFVNQVGEREAQYLLQDVGILKDKL